MRNLLNGVGNLSVLFVYTRLVKAYDQMSVIQVSCILLPRAFSALLYSTVSAKELLQWNGKWHFIHYYDDDDFLTSQFPMFRLLCKSVVVGSSVGASPVHCFLEYPLILSCLRNILSVNTDDSIKEHSFTVSCLMNKCGFSLKLLHKFLNRSSLKPPDKSDSVLAVFKNYGFSKSHILNLVRRLPTVLLSIPNTTLLPKLEFLQSKGFSSPDVIKIISSYSWVFKDSLENTLVPASDASSIKAIKRCPRVLKASVENMARGVDILRDNGAPEKSVALLIRSRPSVMVSNLENFKKLIEEATLMGFHPYKTPFLEAIRVSTTMNSLCCTHFTTNLLHNNLTSEYQSRQCLRCTGNHLWVRVAGKLIYMVA
ncbi:hypothetical protein SADUNF_Sadunf04G0006900 [Salix dunnii]|uniref:Mitochondrial transcription termination factor family protein n=1 Tax=Salix dunnii TaxID=1413687 RepID=A0A835MZZ2_9ROSI|nr:hypothetical protein SADUNF_Sadunf04G0006900 [Salix dunnii]